MVDTIGMTEERLDQLSAATTEERAAAVEEIWAEMMRYRTRLLDIRAAHYLIYGWDERESSPELTDEQNEKRRQYLISQGFAVTERDDG